MSNSTKGRQGRRIRPAVEMTEAEWEIMKVVWDAEPCAAGTVQEALAQRKEWAYSTVKTTMDRMVDKGFLEITRIRNLQLFRSCMSKAEARRAEFQKMLKRAFDGALPPLMEFLIEQEGVSDHEAAQLRRLVDDTRSKKP
jgi:BlaI family penicillinase repressor